MAGGVFASPSMIICILYFTDCTEKDTSQEEEQKALKIILLEPLVLNLTLIDSIELRIVV